MKEIQIQEKKKKKGNNSIKVLSQGLKKKKKETQIEKLKEIYIGNNSAILSIYLSCLFCVKECCVMAQNSVSLVMCKKDLWMYLSFKFIERVFVPLL